MFMPELYRPLEKSLGEAFAPAEEALA